MAIALTIGLIAWIEEPAFGFSDLALLIVRQLGLGLLRGGRPRRRGDVGILASPRFDRGVRARRVGRDGCTLVRRGRRDRGSGFLAVYLVGLAVGSTPSRYRGQLVAFHEGLAFLSQVAMFVVLGLLVFPPTCRRLRFRACCLRPSSGS